MCKNSSSSLVNSTELHQVGDGGVERFSTHTRSLSGLHIGVFALPDVTVEFASVSIDDVEDVIDVVFGVRVRDVDVVRVRDVVDVGVVDAEEFEAVVVLGEIAECLLDDRFEEDEDFFDDDDLFDDERDDDVFLGGEDEDEIVVVVEDREGEECEGLAAVEGMTQLRDSLALPSLVGSVVVDLRFILLDSSLLIVFFVSTVLSSSRGLIETDSEDFPVGDDLVFLSFTLLDLLLIVIEVESARW